MRLNQHLAACGLGSRRTCERLITEQRVLVNGAPAHFGTRVTTADEVLVDGVRVEPHPLGRTWMLHKPPGVLCTADDPHGRPTVVDLARPHVGETRVFPVGRLDLETTGLLLLTNDGDLAHRLMHPSWDVEKEYEATIEKPASEANLQRLRTGVELEDGRTRPARVTQERQGARVLLRLVLHEGRNRQVRRMLAAVGHPVLALHRVRVGPLRLGDLQRGNLRPLAAAEQRALEKSLNREPRTSTAS